MSRLIRLTSGGWLLLVLLILGAFAIALLQDTYQLWHGVTARGVITGVGTVDCGNYKHHDQELTYSVRFIDQTGQAHTSTISQCDSSLNASPGDSVTIVYLPDDPTTIMLPDIPLTNVRIDLSAIIFCGLITLLLLPLWIRKRIRQASLQRQEEQAAAGRWRAMRATADRRYNPRAKQLEAAEQRRAIRAITEQVSHPNGDHQD